ncbi:MAG: M24 family metallopeptidase [Nitrospinota bacterium]
MYLDLTEEERVELEETIGKGLCPPLPAGVWEDRIARCRALMKDGQLDAILVYSGGQVLTGREWARYFANYKEPLWNGESFILVPVEGEPCFIINFTHMVPLVQKCSPIKDVRAYAYFGEANRYSAMVPHLQSALKERGLTGGRIGLCRHGMQGDFLPSVLEHTFKTALSKEKLDDASSLLWDLTSIKTDYDVEMIRKSNAVVSDGVEAIYGALGEGRKEHEYYAAFWEAVCDRGAEVDEASTCHVDSQTAPGSELPNKPFSVTLRRLRKGDTLMIDPGVTYRGYVSDLSRTAVIGQPSAAQKKIFEATMTGHQAMVEALKPGVTVGELCETYYTAIEMCGYRRQQTHVLHGHGIGFMKNEPPILSGWAPKYIIKKGMTICVETALMEINTCRARIEDCYLVTDGDAERLTPGPQDMYIA